MKLAVMAFPLGIQAKLSCLVVHLSPGRALRACPLWQSYRRSGVQHERPFQSVLLREVRRQPAFLDQIRHRFRRWNGTQTCWSNAFAVATQLVVVCEDEKDSSRFLVSHTKSK